jgi:hypothetical protein
MSIIDVADLIRSLAENVETYDTKRLDSEVDALQERLKRYGSLDHPDALFNELAAAAAKEGAEDELSNALRALGGTLARLRLELDAIEDEESRASWLNHHRRLLALVGISISLITVTQVEPVAPSTRSGVTQIQVGHREQHEDHEVEREPIPEGRQDEEALSGGSAAEPTLSEGLRRAAQIAGERWPWQTVGQILDRVFQDPVRRREADGLISPPLDLQRAGAMLSKSEKTLLEWQAGGSLGKFPKDTRGLVHPTSGRTADQSPQAYIEAVLSTSAKSAPV